MNETITPRQDLISICVTTFNRADLLAKCIKQLQLQVYEHFEIIIVNDCSTDDTHELCLSLVQEFDNISYIKNETNCGLAYNRNEAIKKAKGKYFTFCDDDDIFYQDYLLEFMRVINPDIPNLIYCTPSGNQQTFKPYPYSSLPLDEFIMKGYTPPVAGQFYPTELIHSFLYNADIKSGVDHDLWLAMYGNDIRLSILNKHLSEPDAYSKGHLKMTSNYEVRRKKIEASIKIWKSEHQEKFPPNYFEYLAEEYRNYLKYKKAILKIKGNLLYCFIYVTAIKKYILNKKSKHLLPTFKNYE